MRKENTTKMFTTKNYTVKKSVHFMRISFASYHFPVTIPYYINFIKKKKESADQQFNLSLETMATI